MDKKIRILVIPSDKYGCGKFRSVDPHVYIAEHYKDEFDVEITYSLEQENLEQYLRKFDIIHIHKCLDKECKVIELAFLISSSLFMIFFNYSYFVDLLIIWVKKFLSTGFCVIYID